MSFSEILQFSVLSSLSEAIYLLYSLLFGVAFYFVLWGLRWSINKKWKGGSKCLYAGSLVAAALAVSFLGVQGAEQYIQKQKVELLNSLRDDVAWRSDAMTRAWNQLDVADNQSGLKHPDAGGSQIRVKSIAHIQIYTQQVAAVLESLLGSLPDSPPGVEYRTEEDVALQIANDSNQIQLMEYPEELSLDNFLADEVMEIRVEELFDAKNNGVEARAGSLNQALIILLALVLLIFGFVTMREAWKDLVRPC